MPDHDSKLRAPGLLRVVLILGGLIAAGIVITFSLRGCGDERSPQARALNIDGARTTDGTPETTVPAARSNDPAP